MQRLTVSVLASVVASFSMSTFLPTSCWAAAATGDGSAAGAAPAQVQVAPVSAPAQVAPVSTSAAATAASTTNAATAPAQTAPAESGQPDVQAQINADLDRMQQQGFDEINAQLDRQITPPNAGQMPSPQDYYQANAQVAPNMAGAEQAAAQAAAQTAPQAVTQAAPQTAPMAAPIAAPNSAQNAAQAQMATQTPGQLAPAPQNLQPVAMVKMADGNVYPVYVAPGQQFDANLAHAPAQATAYLAVPANQLPNQGTVMPLQNQVPATAQTAPTPQPQPTAPTVKIITNNSANQGQKVDTTGQGIDPYYSPRVKVYGNKTPTMISTRDEARNYLNDLKQSGIYDYNVNASQGANAGLNQYYNNYYNGYGNPTYDPYYGTTGKISYYQGSDGKWHMILGFRYDPSINNYVPIFKDIGSCVGPDCPLVYDPQYPNAGLPRPNPYPPQGPATGQPPTWGPPPSWGQPPNYRPDPVDPGFTHPGTGYYPRPPQPSYPAYPNRPIRPDPVDPGFTHPYR